MFTDIIFCPCIIIIIIIFFFGGGGGMTVVNLFKT